MPINVLCEVVNCTYNAKKRCHADEIFVVSHSGNKASESGETDCKTFKPEDL